MIKLFKKQKELSNKPVESNVEGQNQYPEIVQQIHRDFYSASDKLLQEANDIIKLAEEKNIKKIERLKLLGLNNCKEVVENEEVINEAKKSELTSRLIKDYAYRYPNNKFITEKQVIEICNKYNLVMGDISRFKGFVPEKNLREIENFKVKSKDVSNYIVRGSLGEFIIDEEDIEPSHLNYLIKRGESFVQYSNGEINVKGGNAKFGEWAKVFVESPKLKICAPIKDMNTTGLYLKNGYLLTKKYIPDPVVLQPVKGGYLIVTAWGDEASDPIVVNQINN